MGGCGIFRGVGVIESASSCIQTLYLVLTDVILGSSGSGEGISEGSWSTGSTFLQGGATTSAVDADICIRCSCIIIGDDVY